MDNVLTPTAAQKTAWQLLGYRRWIERKTVRIAAQSARREQSSLQTTAAILRQSFAAEQTPKNVSKIELPSSQTITENPQTTTTASVFHTANGALYAVPSMTVLAANDSHFLWILPALWWQNARWRLFADALEMQLWQQALSVCGLQKEAAAFSDFDALTLPKPQPMAIPEFAERKKLWIGTREYWQKIVSTAAATDIYCPHPAILLRKPEQKYQLWQTFIHLSHCG